MMVEVVCAHCGGISQKEASAVNRARRGGFRLFCSRRCFGLDRALNRPEAEKKRMKSEYDAKRREALRPILLEKKREYHRRTYTPERGREYRRTRTFDHTAYCRRYYADPTKKQAKIVYDKQRLATLKVGEFAECMILLNELWKEIRKQEPSWYERAKAKGFLLKLSERKHDRQDRRSA